MLRLRHFLGRAVSGRPALQEDNSSTTIVLMPSVIQQELAAYYGSSCMQALPVPAPRSGLRIAAADAPELSEELAGIFDRY